MSDLINNLALENYCREMTRHGSTVYRYSFEHFNPATSRPLNFLLPFVASTHCTELAYVFDVNFFVAPWRRTKRDREVASLTTRLWTDFAKSGDPNGTSGEMAGTDRWEPVEEQRLRKHLAIRGLGGVMEEELVSEAQRERVEKLAAGMREFIQ